MVRTTSPRRSSPWLVILLVVALGAALWWTLPVVLTQAGVDAAARASDGAQASRSRAAESAGEHLTEGGFPMASQDVAAKAKTALTANLGAVDAKSGALVLDLNSGKTLASRNAGDALVPASSNKLFTLLAAAQYLDPYERLSTRVVAAGAPGELTVVAGGDTMLAPGASDPRKVNGRAGVDTLALATAQALQKDKVDGHITVALDTRIFSGPALNPAWDPGDVAAGEITAVEPLAFYAHREPLADGSDPGDTGARPKNAANNVVEVFRQRLSHHLGGTEVKVSAALASKEDIAQGREIARVESAPLYEQAGVMMGRSDNSLAEVIARLAARGAGEEGSVVGVQHTLTRAVTERGISHRGLRIMDGSGMSLQARTTPETLAQVVRSLATEERDALWARTLPVAGSTGTLSERFDDPQEQAARGVARAKTGTLNHVASLSGYVQRPDGSVLVYALILNDLGTSGAHAKDALDRTVAALAQG